MTNDQLSQLVHSITENLTPIIEKQVADKMRGIPALIQREFDNFVHYELRKAIGKAMSKQVEVQVKLKPTLGG